MLNLRLLKLSDAWLWIAIALLVSISLFAIFSATFSMQAKFGGDPLLFVKRQLISLLVGVIGMAFFAYLDYKHLKKASPYLYFATLFLLFVIIFGGSSAQGAQRWFQLGPFSFQPSEISKIVFVMVLALFFSQKRELNVMDALSLLAMVAIPFLLIFKQPDLGTALVFFFILIGMLAASWSSPKLLALLITPMISILLRPFPYVWLIYLIALAVALFLIRASLWDWVLILGLNIGVGLAMPFIWGMLKAYQRMRIIAFINPGSDPYGAGYHTLQSMIAIGGGGLFGKGFLRGTQTQLQFIPEQHSDFIFSQIGEEFGFIGVTVVLALFLIIIWRSLLISARSSDGFGSVLAAGIAVMTLFHVLANVGMTVGLLPVVGIPLPFLSYGGTSLLMNLIAVGILQSVAMRRQKIIF